MKRLLLFLPLVMAVSACDSFSQKAQTIKECKEILIPSLLDIESYRERSEYRIIQSEKDNPVVYGWEWNSRNSMGGYTQPNLQLCYRDADEEIITQSFEFDDDAGIEAFLRETSPSLQKKEEERLAMEKTAREEERRQVANAKRKADEARTKADEAKKRAEEAEQRRREEIKRIQEKRIAEAKPEAERVRKHSNSLESYCNSLNGKKPNFLGLTDLKQPAVTEDVIHKACTSGNWDYWTLNVWNQVQKASGNTPEDSGTESGSVTTESYASSLESLFR